MSLISIDRHIKKKLSIHTSNFVLNVCIHTFNHIIQIDIFKYLNKLIIMKFHLDEI